MADSDLPVRIAAFRWLEEQCSVHGEELPRALLQRGFDFAGNRVPLLGPQGIFKPKVCRLPLSIVTVAKGPYSDEVDSGGLIHYKYRGEDPLHHENVGLRTAMKEQAPLVYFHAHVKSWYFAIWPVFVVGDDPGSLTFSVAADLLERSGVGARDVAYEDPTIRRAYATSLVRRRLHQRRFSDLVIQAYDEQCALCRLRHRQLLDAAHIVPDRDPKGEPRIANGLALCKLHHAAFDGYFLTVDPDYRIVVSQKLLEEKDGPMLLHGLQELHGGKIVVPHHEAQRPDRDLLARRLEVFASR